MIAAILFFTLPLISTSQVQSQLINSPPKHCGIYEVVANYELRDEYAYLTMFSKSQNEFRIKLAIKPNNTAKSQFSKQKVRASIEILHLDSPRLATAKGLKMSLEIPEASALHQGDGFRLLELKKCTKNP